VPADAHARFALRRAGRHGADELVEARERREEERAGRCHEEERQQEPRPVRNEEEAREVGVAVRRVRELGNLVAERARAGRRSARLAQRRTQPRPREPRLGERTGRVLRERRARLGAEDDERTIAVGPHRRRERQIALVVMERAPRESAERVGAAGVRRLEEGGRAPPAVAGEDAGADRAQPVGRAAERDAQAARGVAAQREPGAGTKVDGSAHRPAWYPRARARPLRSRVARYIV
jgi:hypothetical protein